MARLTVETPTDLINQLRRLHDGYDEMAEEMLIKGIKPLYSSITQKVASHRDTAQMIMSIKNSDATKDAKGVWRKKIEFKGYDKYRDATPSDPRGVPNARKAFSIEYGTSKQKAQPFIRPAIEETEKEVLQEMQYAFNRGLRP